jgi:hypothetical protein
MADPKTPKQWELRSHPRLSLRASIELHPSGERLVLTTRNLSLGGVALTAAREQVARLPVGSRHIVTLFDGADPHVEPVRTIALVVRHDGDGVALRWIIEDAKTAPALVRLMDHIKKRR